MQILRCSVKNLFLPLIFVHILATFVIASGGEEGHSATWSEWLWRIINFSILVFLLYILLSKFRLKELLTKRSEGIAKAIKDAEEAKETAKKGFATIQDRLREKDKEVEGILNAARTDGEKEKASLIREGERMGEGLIGQARENIDQEVRKAKESLREEAVNLALELAEGKIKENLKKEDQERILTTYLKKIGGDGN